jgi:hypothetical protein
MVALEFVQPLRGKEFFMLAVVGRTEPVIPIFSLMVALAVAVILAQQVLTVEMALPILEAAVVAVVMELQRQIHQE